MSDQYDDIARSFDEVESVIRFVRENLEFPSFRRALGPLTGKQVLDVGCGEGTFTRMIMRQGARRVVGIDQSEGMIKLAQTIEAREPLGIEYLVQDMVTMPALEAFDVVTAVHVLHYADSRESMAHLAQRMFANLAPGGRLVALLANAESSARSEEASGFRTHRPDNPREGERFRVSVLTTPPTDVWVHHWPSESIVSVLESAGFTGFSWHAVAVADSVAPEDLERARQCAENPTSRLLTATRP
ncbi:class I SAM-dependent methyltransferase [Micromonospora sp. KC721]|uniref:class I SAM-dependent methyltransferase n=1 Tax=Micromonospora sp. KC721 TaxID=2530380 RepID=UPI0010450F3A|nr:class I SAM-dependent methyltransferase [Micromonospora sp. KC721]TDB82554.1 class I SAM-dependent methyltransferase [Micromonospora sp. KC721]